MTNDDEHDRSDEIKKTPGDGDAASQNAPTDAPKGDQEQVDEESKESFPASDPPANY